MGGLATCFPCLIFDRIKNGASCPIVCQSMSEESILPLNGIFFLFEAFPFWAISRIWKTGLETMKIKNIFLKIYIYINFFFWLKF